MIIKSITVHLTPEQIERIEPMMEKVKEAYASGAPGMLLAQVFSDRMKVFFATREQAHAIQAAMGCPVGVVA